jgi:hypothetical protein
MFFGREPKTRIEDFFNIREDPILKHLYFLKVGVPCRDFYSVGLTTLPMNRMLPVSFS